MKIDLVVYISREKEINFLETGYIFFYDITSCSESPKKLKSYL